MAVLDTSALIRLYIPDGPLPDGVEAVMEQMDQGLTEVLVPGLIWLETASVMLKKALREEVTVAEAEELLRHWRTLPLREVDVGNELVHVFSLARRENLSVYDATFLQVAIRYQAPLFTADEKLRNAAERFQLSGGTYL